MPAIPKDELRELITQARTDQALLQLLELLAGAPDWRTSYNELIALRGQLTSTESNFKLTLIDYRELTRQTTRINFAVMGCLDRLPDEIKTAKSKTAATETALLRTLESIAADADWEYDLFFSFSSEDMDAARDFCHTLRGYGLRVFFSADDLRLRVGQSFGSVIEKALGQSRHFLLFCTPPAMQSEWVTLERETFFQQYHLKNKEQRSFHIAEGPAFAEDLVPAFYRRYQRLRGPEDLLQSLAIALPPGFDTAEGPHAPKGSREASPRAATNENPAQREAAGSHEAKPRATAADEHAWEFTTDAGTRAAFEKYLTRFSQGFYAAEARARIEAFEADDTAWEFASETGTEKALQKYLQKYPEGLHVEEAREQLSVFDLERRAGEERQAQAAQREKSKQDAGQRKIKALENARAAKAAAAESRSVDPFHDLMVHIKGGTFDMGDTFGEGYDDEKPVHKVTLSDFYLCKYPVTQGQWKAVMGNNPSYFKGDDMLPVEMVSWDDTQEFIKKLNEKTGLKYRLPTEAEWEFAAREGGKKVRFGNGKDVADPAEMNFSAEEEYKTAYSKAGEYRKKTTPVGQFKPNALALHDMSGNVWEWCADWHEWDYYKDCQAKGAVINPLGPEAGQDRVVRGGSWGINPLRCRAAHRHYFEPAIRYVFVGFRLALAFQ